MMRGLFLVPAFLVATCTLSFGSSEFGGPSPNLLFQLQKQNRGHPWLRIATDSTRATLRVERIDELGLGGLSGRKSDPEPPDRIDWPAISRIDEVVTREHQGRVAGFILIGLAAAGLGNAIGAPDNQGKSDALIGLAVFGTLGAWQGGRLGERFIVGERPWYVAAPRVAGSAAPEGALPADSMLTAYPPRRVEAPRDASLLRLTASRAVLRACARIDRDDLIRIRGDFGQFQGFASVVGPEGMDGLRTDRKRRDHVTGSAPVGLVTWDRIHEVEKRGGSVRKGALVGATILGVLGGLVSAAAVAVADGSEKPTTALVEGALVSGAVGAGLGGLIGATIPGWHVVYRRG